MLWITFLSTHTLSDLTQAMAMMMEMLMKKQTPKVTQNAIWSPPRKKDLGVAVLVFDWSRSKLT